MTIKVGVLGAKGRMGAEVCRAVEAADDLELVAGVDVGDDRDPLAAAEVVVDFTTPGAVMDNVRWCVEHGRHAVVGTTGFDDHRIAEIDALVSANSGIGVVIAPNFGIGAVLMMRFAAAAAPHFESVEIIELHHDQKLDAPSGTAARTARMISEAGGPDDVPIHSVRLPGIIANQEVIFGEVGQTLTIRHDTTDRRSFMPGVVLAVRKVGSMDQDLVVGLEHLLD